jgi:hypothetical protein
MAARLDVELAMSTAASMMTTVVIIHLSSLGQARMLPQWQSSFDQCLNHQLRRDGKPMRSCVPFLNVLGYSWPKAPCLNDMGLSTTSSHHQQHVRRKPGFT